MAATEVGGEAENEKLHEVDLMTLSFPQLHQLKSQIDQTCTVLQSSLETLKITQNKLKDSGECLTNLEPSGEGAPVLIPLSSSMYVPGRIADTNYCIIDIGTGYYVKKTVDEGKKYFKRKVDYIAEQMDKIQPLFIEKANVREAIMEVIEIKAQQANALKNKA